MLLIFGDFFSFTKIVANVFEAFHFYFCFSNRFGLLEIIQLLLYLVGQQTTDSLLESGYSLLKEQQLIMENKLSKEYMKNIED
jgi:hypothetical protein